MKYFNWTLVIAWMGIIFFLSHQPAETSGALSGGVLEKILIIITFFENVFNLTFNREVLHLILRKGAHFTAYFILGILLINALDDRKKHNSKKMYFQALIIALFYGVSDEYHQTFILGRAGQFQDVLIDGSGALASLIFWRFWKKTLHRRNIDSFESK